MIYVYNHHIDTYSRISNDSVSLINSLIVREWSARLLVYFHYFILNRFIVDNTLYRIFYLSLSFKMHFIKKYSPFKVRNFYMLTVFCLYGYSMEIPREKPVSAILERFVPHHMRPTIPTKRRVVSSVSILTGCRGIQSFIYIKSLYIYV